MLSQSRKTILLCSSPGNGVSDGSDMGLEAGLAMFERCLKRQGTERDGRSAESGQ